MFKKGFFENIGFNRFKKYPNYRKKYQSLTTVSQISFLLGLISEYKFSNNRKIENVLEIGIHNGVTSLYMLKEGCRNQKNYKQYGIDIGNGCFFGECVEKEATEQEKEHFLLSLKSTTLDIEKIIPESEKLDMVFIDGGHSHPHPLIDLLCVIPYLHEESIVVLHDVITYMRPNAWGESFIFEAWENYKYRNVNLLSKNLPEEGMGVLTSLIKNKNELYNTLLEVAKTPFRAAPWKFDEIYLGINEETIVKLRSFMYKHYDTEFTDKIIDCFYNNLKEYKKEALLRIHETRFYNYLYEKINRKSLLELILQNIFYIKKIRNHNVINILGIKIKIKEK